MFDRLQHEMLGDDIELLWRVLRHAVAAGRLPAEALAAVDIRGIPPTLAVRDRSEGRPGRSDSGPQRGDVGRRRWPCATGWIPEQEQQLIRGQENLG